MNFADLSHHQSALNITVYKVSRPRIALKCTEGTGFTDNRFAERWKAAKDAGLARIAYHYQRVDTDPVAQWVHCIDTVKAAGGLTSRDRICLDVEDVAGTTNNVKPGAAKNAALFCQAAVADGVPEGLVYSGNWYLRPNQITASVFPAGWRNLWISEYSTKGDAEITVPMGWAREMIVARQYTASGHVAGVDGLCDDSRVLRDWLTVSAPATNTEDDGMTADPQVLDLLSKIVANTAATAANVEKIYRIGFKAQNTDGSQAETVENDSVHGLNMKAVAAIEHLAGIHDVLMDAVNATDAPGEVTPNA